MKKILLSIGVVLIASAASAQTVAYSASNLTEFSGMSIVDADNDTYTWGVIDMMTANGGAPVGTTYDSQGEVLISESWGGSNPGVALTPDNWVISPAINLTALTTANLSFGRSALDPAWPAEKYSVYVVTAADQTALATALATATAVYSETISVGGEWLVRNVDVSSFAGMNNVYVAFRHHDCTDNYILVLDDITVEGAASLTENSVTATVYPNPASDVLNIKLSANASSVSILGMDGKVISTESVNSNTVELNVSNLVAGVYFYEVVAENGTVVRNTFVKK